MEYNGYSIESDGTFGHFHIKPLGRGSVPVKLRGAYTNTAFAMKAIDAQISSKGAKDAKAKNSK